MDKDEKTPMIMAIDPGLGAASRLVDPATASIDQEPQPQPTGPVASRHTSSRSGGSPMSTIPKSSSETQAEVERAVLAVRRAIDRLVRLLGDDDLAAVNGAALALVDLGARADSGDTSAARPARPRAYWAAFSTGAAIMPSLAFRSQAALSSIRPAGAPDGAPVRGRDRTPASGATAASSAFFLAPTFPPP
jgi:hypothetical protein